MALCSLPKVEPSQCFDKHQFEYLNSQQSLSWRISAMADMLSLREDDLAEREGIVKYLYDLLKPYYPECDILIFGSSANGFGFQGCDLDLLFLPFPGYCNLDFKDKGSNVKVSPFQVLSDERFRKKLYEMDEERHLNFVKRVMYGTRGFFKNIHFIPAKCPILNIEFYYSSMQCDFSASNRLVLYNTQLLWMYGRLDSGVKPLVMFLRYWAKSLGFISKTLLSSYGLTLLVIFYLQNTNPAILPSVQKLNELAGYSRIIDGWETALCLDPMCINANQYEDKDQINRKTLSELLIEFFDFYWNFDFVKYIVSVNCGKPLPVKKITESKDERIKTFQVKPFSIQDPFILSRNVSRNTAMKTTFKLSLKIAKKLLLNRNYNFKLLFDSTYYQDEINAIFASTKSSLPAQPMYLNFQLTYEIHSKLAITSQLKPWFDRAIQSIIDVLQIGLLIECEVVDKAVLDDEVKKPPFKKQKFNNTVVGTLENIACIQCVVNFPTVWRRNRIEVLNHLKKTAANLEVEDSDVVIPPGLKTEYKISKELCKDEIKTVTKLPEVEAAPPYFSFFCNCFRFSESQLSDFIISFSFFTNKKTCNATKEFLRAFVLKHFKCSILEEV